MHAGRELPDEAHLQMRRDILASILYDIHAIYPCKFYPLFTDILDYIIGVMVIVSMNY